MLRKIEIQVVCKHPDCRYTFGVSHFGKIAQFDKLEDAFEYIDCLEKRDRLRMAALLEVPRVTAGESLELSEFLWHECPKCYRVFRYHALDHFLQLPKGEK